MTAAGDAAVALLLRAPDSRRRPLVLMQQAEDFWGLPGGTRRSHETLVQVALREAAGQAAVDPDQVRVRGALVHHPNGDASSFTSVIADTTKPLVIDIGRTELAWIPEDDVPQLPVHPTFAAAWPTLGATRIGLVVDAANVVGSRPDGWWKDRAGAAERFQRKIAAAGPGVLPLPDGGFGWVDSPVVVLEGGASRACDVHGVEVVRAPGAADDTIIDIVTASGNWLVVTADRPLRARLPPHVHPLSPSAFLSWIGG